jgi:hypothetical protein
MLHLLVYFIAGGVHAAPLLIGLFAASTPESLRAPQLSTAAALLGVPGAPPLAVVEVPAPAPLLQLLADDRISVSARAAMLAGERRSHSDLADAAAASLALGHAAAWERLLASSAEAALVVVDPGSAVAGAATLVEPLQRGVGAMWGAAPPADLLLLGALVPPAAARAPADGALAAAGWRVPLQWRGWHAYVLTRRGATVLLSQGAAPASQRAEAHASALADLGLLRALWLPGAPPAPARAPGWAGGGGGGSGGGGGGTALGALLEERVCDLCDVPEDYSRFGHVFGTAGPVAVAAGLVSGWVAFRCLPRRAAAPAAASTVC